MKKTLLFGVLLIFSFWIYFYFSFRKPDSTAVTSKFNQPLIAELDSMLVLDQKYRNQLDSFKRIYQNDSEQMHSFYRLMQQTDSSNLVRVKEILEEFGWPGPELIGPNGSTALFLVIQHSDQVTQERYLPLMRQAVKQGKAAATDLALLEDRILIGQGKKQIYGSQIGFNDKLNSYYILPLADPDNVDKMRLAVGLEPLADYASQFLINWNPQRYKLENK